MARTSFLATFILLCSLMTGFAQAAEPGASVNINTATATELASLNGIGDSKAAAIIRYREQHGAFASADDLSNVKGIGNKTVADNADRISLK